MCRDRRGELPAGVSFWGQPVYQRLLGPKLPIKAVELPTIRGMHGQEGKETA